MHGICWSQTSVMGNIISSGSVLYAKIDTVTCIPSYANGTIVNEREFLIVDEMFCEKSGMQFFIILKANTLYLLEKIYFKNRKTADSLLQELKLKTPDLNTRITLAKEEYSRLKKEADKLAKWQEEQNKKELDSLQKSIDKSLAIFRTKNLVLKDFEWSYANEYSSFTDVEVEVINPWKQKIKYIWFTLIAHNPVGDLVKDGFSGATYKTVKGIGPIEYSASGSYKFESVFYSKVIETMTVKTIKIQFFDGSIKIINNPILLKGDE